jgi:hypothetical protein
LALENESCYEFPYHEQQKKISNVYYYYWHAFLDRDTNGFTGLYDIGFLLHSVEMEGGLYVLDWNEGMYQRHWVWNEMSIYGIDRWAGLIVMEMDMRFSGRMKGMGRSPAVEDT